MSDNYGPDGWRTAYVIFSSGRRHLSRKKHYFKDGVSLCGAHNDRTVKKFDTTVIKWVYPPKRCKKCGQIWDKKEAEK